MVVTVPMMAMPMEAMAVMTTVAVMATVPAVTTMATASEDLSRDSQRSSGQRQRRDTGHNDFLNSSHERLLGLCSARIALL
jgi:hypothetical protein